MKQVVLILLLYLLLINITMRNMMMSYLAICAVFFAIDLTWLGIVAKDIYAKYLKDFLSPEINWQAAIIFYLLFIV